LAAYFRGGSIIQSWQTEAVEPVGNWYSVLVNVKGVLAVYRNREVKSESVLKCLKRWPKEVTEAFVRTTNLNLLIDDRQNRDSWKDPRFIASLTATVKSSFR
jgi:hypothetical protein